MRHALHLVVQKALSMVASHYQVDFVAVSMGYVIPDGVDEETVMNRADALAAPTTNVLAEDFGLPLPRCSRGRRPSSLKITRHLCP
jgi:uncharacterized protein YgfB (UPF0149 family)